jgi:hypothetical protein
MLLSLIETVSIDRSNQPIKMLAGPTLNLPPEAFKASAARLAQVPKNPCSYQLAMFNDVATYLAFLGS